ncbi:MAG: hypothetical protein H0W08_04830 [Acidobacteria bacterium]|nr:hypothetical protein [Acidobacteriota bacterium]
MGLALGLTSGLSVLTGLLFGALPASRASPTDVLISLRDQSCNTTSRSAVRNTLLAAQVSLNLVLLAVRGCSHEAAGRRSTHLWASMLNGVVSASVNAGLAPYDEGRAHARYAGALERDTRTAAGHLRGMGHDGPHPEGHG